MPPIDFSASPPWEMFLLRASSLLTQPNEPGDKHKFLSNVFDIIGAETIESLHAIELDDIKELSEEKGMELLKKKMRCKEIYAISQYAAAGKLDDNATIEDAFKFVYAKNAQTMDSRVSPIPAHDTHQTEKQSWYLFYKYWSIILHDDPEEATMPEYADQAFDDEDPAWEFFESTDPAGAQSYTTARMNLHRQHFNKEELAMLALARHDLSDKQELVERRRLAEGRAKGYHKKEGRAKGEYKETKKKKPHATKRKQSATKARRKDHALWHVPSSDGMATDDDDNSL